MEKTVMCTSCGCGFPSMEMFHNPNNFEISYLQMVYLRPGHELLPQNQMIVLSIVF
jgi:hypothetical protein